MSGSANYAEEVNYEENPMRAHNIVILHIIQSLFDGLETRDKYPICTLNSYFAQKNMYRLSV